MSIHTRLRRDVHGVFYWGFLSLLLIACGESKDIRKQYYSDGALQQETEYKNNIPIGKSTTYYPNGKVKSVAFFKNGQLDSVSTSYYENERVKSIRRYQKGVLEGPYENYYENGNLSGKGVFAGGVRQGYGYEYFKEEPGIVKKRTYYYNFQGKEAIQSATTYKKDGSVFGANPGDVIVETPSDTVKQGQPIAVSFSLSDKDQELQAVILGNYDNQFRLTDSTSLDTTKATSRQLTINYTTKKAGWQPIRGTALVRLAVQYTGNTQRISVKPVYFEKGLFVKE